MISLLWTLSGSTVGFIETGAASVARDASVEQAAAKVSATTDPIAFTFWIVALVALAGIWILLSRPPYPTRRCRLSDRRGPITRLVDALMGRTTIYL